MSAFTPHEVADDFEVPAEVVLSKLCELGVAEESVRPNRPLSESCTASQVA